MVFSPYKNSTTVLIDYGLFLYRVSREQHNIGETIWENGLGEALNYCFKFVGETAKTWTRLKKTNYAHTMRFQTQIFPEKITFDGKKFGTDKLSLVYKINQQSGAEKSKVVSHLSVGK